MMNWTSLRVRKQRNCSRDFNIKNMFIFGGEQNVIAKFPGCSVAGGVQFYHRLKRQVCVLNCFQLQDVSLLEGLLFYHLAKCIFFILDRLLKWKLLSCQRKNGLLLFFFLLKGGKLGFPLSKVCGFFPTPCLIEFQISWKQFQFFFLVWSSNFLFLVC